MTPLAIAALEWVHLMGPLDQQQLAQDMAYLREKLGRADIPEHTFDDLIAAIQELVDADRVVRSEHGLEWRAPKAMPTQWSLFG